MNTRDAASCSNRDTLIGILETAIYYYTDLQREAIKINKLQENFDHKEETLKINRTSLIPLLRKTTST